MRRVALALLVVTLSVSGCRSETDLGECVGVNDTRDPGLTYKVSIRNVILGVFFIETIVVPLVVLFDELSCPVARRATP